MSSNDNDRGYERPLIYLSISLMTQELFKRVNQGPDGGGGGGGGGCGGGGGAWSEEKTDRGLQLGIRLMKCIF